MIAVLVLEFGVLDDSDVNKSKFLRPIPLLTRPRPRPIIFGLRPVLS